jgi:hypothetical protein
VIGVEKNITLAKLLYAKAGELEAVYTTYGLSWATTNGAAPYLASTLASLELWTLQFDSMRHWLRGTGEAERDRGVGDGLLLPLFGLLVGLSLLRFLRQRLR